MMQIFFEATPSSLVFIWKCNYKRQSFVKVWFIPHTLRSGHQEIEARSCNEVRWSGSVGRIRVNPGYIKLAPGCWIATVWKSINPFLFDCHLANNIRAAEIID